ncbi:MAG: aminotransferase class V-fold PLP-dependent enzyme, partial [Chloroflexi bacterium]|nr:aminotransferase class V-fold PLP-dependent enzyme [Chloroflexota bacterium]
MAIDTATDTKVETLRAQLPAVQTTGYFNTGSNGPIPTLAYEAADMIARRELEQGRIVPGTYIDNRERNRGVAALVAALFGADPDEIALTHSATEGLGTALIGLTWNPGDEIVTTREEHPGLMMPLALLARRFGVVTRYADIGDGASGVVEALASQITSRTRLIALSHVLWSTGAVLPLRDISELARRYELMVVVDGAQSAGQVPVDLHAMGIDAYAMAGQKWLCGPEATGLLYIRKDRFTDIAPTYVRYGQFEPSGYFIPAEGAKRYEIGEFYRPAVAAQETALRWLRDEVGFEWAHDRIAALGADFRRRLTSIDGVNVVTPTEPMAGLVNFNIAGLRPQEVATQLYERGYTIRYVESVPCSVSARASVGWWNTEDEVAGLASAIADLAREACVLSG